MSRYWKAKGCFTKCTAAPVPPTPMWPIWTCMSRTTSTATQAAYRPARPRTARRQRFDHRRFRFDDLCLCRGDQGAPVASPEHRYALPAAGCAAQRGGECQCRAAGRHGAQEVAVGAGRGGRAFTRRLHLFETLLRRGRHRPRTRHHDLHDRRGEAHAQDDEGVVAEYRAGRLFEIRTARLPDASARWRT